MARVSWRGDLRRMRMRIENLPDELLDQAEEIMEDVAREGADIMRQHIKTRGTSYSNKQGRAGRVEAGHMLKDVEHATKRFRRSVRGEFGWGVDGGEVRPYYAYQENGFQHWISGKDVSPMHAQLDAFMRMREEFFARMRRIKLGR